MAPTAEPTTEPRSQPAAAPTPAPEPGVVLHDGVTRVVHGSAVDVRSAFPPELGIPGTLHLFTKGRAGGEASSPAFCGAMGVFPFDTSMRMPRHVHVSPPVAVDALGRGPDPAAGAGDGAAAAPRYIVEKVLAIAGIGLAELAGEIYVVPPMSMVLIGAGVPHSWTACPAGLDLRALGVAGPDYDGELVSDGRFLATFEYEDATTFYPTAQTGRLAGTGEYVHCADLHAIRFPALTVEEVVERAWFVWGTKVWKLGRDGDVARS